MKHVLVGTDGSDSAAKAVAAAADLAKLSGARLSVITVGNDAIGRDLRELTHAEGGIGAALDLLLNRNLLEARDVASRHGMQHVETHTGWGDPAELMLETAVRVGADVVVGRRGRGRLTGLLLGSTSQKIVSLTPCPVLVVP